MPESVRVQMNENGRVVIPATVRKELGIKAGDSLFLTVIDHELRLVTQRERIARAQRLVRKYFAPGTQMSEELISDRREEAVKESQNG